MGEKKKGREEERNGSVGKGNLDDETGMRMSIVGENLFVFGDIESSISRYSGQLEIEDSTGRQR